MRPVMFHGRLALATAFVLGAGLFACSRQSELNKGAVPADTAPPGPSPATNDSMLTGFVDRRPEIDPTPAEVTQRRFTILHGGIASIQSSTGRLPENLDDILFIPVSDPNLQPRQRWLQDGWGRGIRYAVRDPSYVLVSAGADGEFDTEDDLRSEGPSPR